MFVNRQVNFGPGGDLDAAGAGVVAMAVAHAFALFVGVSIAANISGGHLNPAVTFGLFLLDCSFNLLPMAW